MSSPVTRPTTIVKPQGKGLGLAALIYSIATVPYFAACFFAANEVSSLDTSAIDAWLPPLPVVVLFGIALCIVAGSKTPRGRKLAITGGLLMLCAPVVLFPVILAIGESS